MRYINCAQRAFCLIILILSLCLNQASIAADSLSTATAAPTCQSTAPSKSLGEFVKAGAASVQLIGDGQTTAQCQLVVTNTKTGEQTTTTIHTVCVSPKTKLPPVSAAEAKSAKLQFSIDPEGDNEAKGIVQSANKLDAQGKFADLPMQPARRANTIAQLAIWKLRGEQSANPIDHVTTATLEESFLTKSHVTKKSLKKAERRDLDNRIAQMLYAADLSIKDSHETTTDRTHTDDGGGANPPGTTTSTTDEHGGKPDLPGAGSGTNTSTGTSPTPSGGTNTNNDYSQIIIPTYTKFRSSNSQYQDMMTVEEGYIPIKYPGTHEDPHHCQGHRLLILIGNPKEPNVVLPGGGRPAGDATMQAVKAWVEKQGQDKATHVLFYPTAGVGSDPNMKHPQVMGAGQFREMTQAEDIKGTVDGWNCCCFYQEVLVIFHGHQTGGLDSLISYLPYLLNGKPTKKLTLWVCSSASNVHPNPATPSANRKYKSLAWYARPQICPCTCAGKCLGHGAIANPCPEDTEDCPAGQPTKIYLSGYYQPIKNGPIGVVSLGAYPVGNGDLQFESPDGNMREITVTSTSAPHKKDATPQPPITVTAAIVNKPCIFAGHQVSNPADDPHYPTPAKKAERAAQLNTGAGVPGGADGMTKTVTVNESDKAIDHYAKANESLMPTGWTPAYTGPTFVSPCGCQPGPPCPAEPGAGEQ